MMEKEEGLKAKPEIFPFSANRRKDMNNRISDFEINFKAVSRKVAKSQIGKH